MNTKIDFLNHKHITAMSKHLDNFQDRRILFHFKSAKPEFSSLFINLQLAFDSTAICSAVQDPPWSRAI